MNHTRTPSRPTLLASALALASGAFGAVAQAQAPAPVEPTVEAAQEPAAAEPEATVPGSTVPEQEASESPAPEATAAPIEPLMSESPPGAATTKSESAASDAEAEALIAELQAESAGAVPTVNEQPSVSLYGFSDFNYEVLLDKEALPPYPPGSFYIGNLNLYLSTVLSERWRSLAEVRFSYLPHGTYPGTARSFGNRGLERTDTTVIDYAENQTSLRWGGIEIERAWIEYSVDSLLNVRGGSWLTPYGIWNVDHGSPTIIGTQRPYSVGAELFPERQTGIELHGKFHVAATTFGYHATISNGRGPIDMYSDLDDNFGLGGRLFLENTSFGTLTLGFSGYTGTYTNSIVAAVPSAAGDLAIGRDIVEQYDEVSLATDLKWEWEGLHVQGEVIVNEAAYDDDERPPGAVLAGVDHYVADYRRLGAYALAGYRTPFFGIMPYVMFETYNFADSSVVPPVRLWSAVGLNVRPDPRIALKVQYNHIRGDDEGTRLTSGAPLQFLRTQVAWAF